ncbi:hypothetical protein ACFWDN_13165 [Micromonospora chalcea]
MAISIRVLILGHLLELDFGKAEDAPAQEAVHLSGGPVGFALPPADDEHDGGE